MNNFECVCEPYEGESCEFTVERFVSGRKDYKCAECSDAIPKGERHQVIVGKSDGEFFTMRTCGFCAAERKRIALDHIDMPPVYGDLACWLVAEILGEMP